MLDEKDKAAALPHLRDPSIPVREVARRLGISVAAIYHHIPGGRGAVLENITTEPFAKYPRQRELEAGQADRG